MNSTTQSKRSVSKRGPRRVISDEVTELKNSMVKSNSELKNSMVESNSELKSTIQLLAGVVFRLTNKSENEVSVDDIGSMLSKSSLSAHSKVKIETENDDVMATEHAIRIAELEAKNQDLQDQFNLLQAQVTTFMGTCRKHTGRLDKHEIKHDELFQYIQLVDRK